MKDRHGYSKAFKLHVMEELRDGKWKSQADAAAAYGLPQSYIHKWMRQLGFEHLKGRTIHVKTRTELDEIKRLKAGNKLLKERLADEVVDHKIDEVTLQIVCRRLGTTPEEARKTASGK
ncbi:MAG: transposase [Kiritimatiellae bacterium]|nr:transposase [Kiritimatiellia bacterium]